MWISYWVFPVIGGCCWLGMLMGMLIGWTVDTHRKRYGSMEDGQTIAYISDIGASHYYKPIFISLGAISTGFFDVGLLCDRLLRHAGRLARNTSITQKVLGVFSVVFALAGTAGIVLLSVFDTYHHPHMHRGFLLLFLAGYVVSAILIVCEYQRLGFHYREVTILAASFWVKLAFIFIEVILAALFCGFSFTHHHNAGAVIEWVVAFVFGFYVLGYAIDLLPAVRTHQHRNFHHYSKRHSRQPDDDDDEQQQQQRRQQQQQQTASTEMEGGRAFTNSNTNTNLTNTNPNSIATPQAMVNDDDMYDRYVQSAARATRPARRNNLSESGFSVNGGAGGLDGSANNSRVNVNSSGGGGVYGSPPASNSRYNITGSAAELPDGPYQPGRAYGSRPAELP